MSSSEYFLYFCIVAMHYGIEYSIQDTRTFPVPKAFKLPFKGVVFVFGSCVDQAPIYSSWKEKERKRERRRHQYENTGAGERNIRRKGAGVKVDEQSACEGVREKVRGRRL